MHHLLSLKEIAIYAIIYRGIDYNHNSDYNQNSDYNHNSDYNRDNITKDCYDLIEKYKYLELEPNVFIEAFKIIPYKNYLIIGNQQSCINISNKLLNQIPDNVIVCNTFDDDNIFLYSYFLGSLMRNEFYKKTNIILLKNERLMPFCYLKNMDYIIYANKIIELKGLTCHIDRNRTRLQNLINDGYCIVDCVKTGFYYHLRK